MDGDDLYSIVVPINGVTLSLLAGALVPSSTPSSNSVPRIPCAEIQNIHQVSVNGTRHENKSSGSPASRPSPDRSRNLETSPDAHQRARSKPRSKPRSRSKSRSRTKKTSCSPVSRKSRPDSKSPKREKRSCSVTSTCSKYCGSSSPNRRSPPSRPLSKDRRRREAELTRTPLESSNRTSSRNYVTEAPTKNSNEVSVRNEFNGHKEKRRVKSTTELAMLAKENPKMTTYVATAKENFNKTLSKDKHTETTRDGFNTNYRTQTPDAKMRCNKAKEDFEKAGSKNILPADAVVNYMTEWLNCVEKIKSFYSDPFDCTGFDACPPLRERMAQHRLMHHTGRGFVPHVSTKRYAFEDSDPRWAENSQRAGRTEMPTKEMIDQPVQTKLTLGDLGEIIIKLDKSVKITKENSNDQKKRRRSNLRGDDYPIDQNRRITDIDYKKHRISRLDSDDIINSNSESNDQNNYEIHETDFNNEKRKMSQVKNSYSGSRHNSSSKRRFSSNNNASHKRYSENKTDNSDKRRQTNDDSSRNQIDDIRNKDKLDMNSYRKYSLKYDDNNKYDSKDGKYIENDDIRNQDRLDMNSSRRYSIKPNDNNEYDSKYGTNIGNDYIDNQNGLNVNSERKYSIKPNDNNDYGSKVGTDIEKTLRRSQNSNNEYSYRNRTSQNDKNMISNNNYAFSEQNPDTATSSKFQGSNVINNQREPLNDVDDNNELDNNISLGNNPTYNSTATYFDKNELNEAVQDWLKNVPLFPDISEKDTIINQLLEKVNDLSHAPIEWEECEKNLEGLVSDHIDKLHVWYPGDKRDQEDYKRNLIQSFIQRIKPIFKQNIKSRNEWLRRGDQMDGTVGSGNTNGKRNSNIKRSSRSKNKYKRVHKRSRGDHFIRSTISSNVICGDTRVRKRKPSEKYRPEFAQEICNWLARYNFVEHDDRQQISMHDLVGILLNRLSPYLDRPYNSTNKLILKAKIVDIINGLPICIHHSPQQKTQVIKFAEELANMLLNIQTRIDDDDDDSNNYRRPVSRRSEFMYISNAVETCKKYYLRTQISEQLRQCLQNTMLSNHLFIQNQLTEVVLNYFELLQSGQKDVARNAIIKALEESNIVEKDKITIANSIIGSLEVLSAKETIDDVIETNLSSKHTVSRLPPVCLSEMEICDTVFAVSTSRAKKEPGLSAQEHEYFEVVGDVIRVWAETLPEPFPKLGKKQKEEFLYELAKDMLIQNKIEKVRPIPDAEREKFWMFFAYRWFYRLNLFKDLNDAEPYGSALCNKMNEALQEKIVMQVGRSEEENEILKNIHKNENETETDTSSANSKDSKKKKAQEKAEERKIRNKEKEEERKIKLQAREEAKQKKLKEKEEAKQKRLLEKEEAKQKRLRQKEEANQKRQRERKPKKGKSSNNSESSDESENPESSKKKRQRERKPKKGKSSNNSESSDESENPESSKKEESSPDEQCTKNCKKLNIVTLDDELPIAPNPNDNHNWKCATLSFQCLQKNQDAKPVISAYSNQPLPHLPPSPPHQVKKPSCPSETGPAQQPQLKYNWKERHDLAQHCPCLRHHKHSHRRRNDESPNIRVAEKYEKFNNNNTKLIQTSSLYLMPQKQHPEDLNTNDENNEDKSINVTVSKAHERYNQIYHVEHLHGEDVPSFSNTSMKNSKEFTPLQKNNMQKDHGALMKEFIKKYLEYSYKMGDPLIRATFFHLLKSELQKTKAYYKQIISTRQFLTSEILEEEFKYIKLISDWLKQMPVEKSFNKTMNKDRILFVKDLAQNIAQIQLDIIRPPHVMNYNTYLESVIKIYVLRLPLLREEQDKIQALIDQLINEINKSRSSMCPNHKSLNGNSKTVKNIEEILDEHIRRNAELFNNDEFVLDVWAHLLVEKVFTNIKECNVMQMFNVSVSPNIPDDEPARFRLQLDYAKEIIELLNILPLLNTPIEIKVKKIHELSKRLLVRDMKLIDTLNDDRADQELVEFIEKWMLDLPLNFDEEANVVSAVKVLEDRITRANRDCTDNAFETKLFSESTIMHYKEKGKRKSSAPLRLISNIIDKWSQCLPIEGHDKENIKVVISKSLYQKTCDLIANTKIYNDDIMYKRYLEDEVIAQLDRIPANAVLKGNKNYLKTLLINKLMASKTGTPEKKIGDVYRKALETAMEEVMPSKKWHQDPDFEIYKHQLTNKFFLDNFDFSKHPEKFKYKHKIQLGINKHVENALHHCEKPMSSHEINNKLYSVLYKVPVPDDNSLKCEVECIKTRCEIDDWFDTLPLKRTTSPVELSKWDNTLMSLAKAVHDIEQEPGNTDKLHKEIMRHLAMFPLECEYDHHRPELAYRLQTLLESTFEARKCGFLDDSPESSLYHKSLLGIDAHRKAYRLDLSDVIYNVLPKPENLTADRKLIVEEIKDEIIDCFIEYNCNKNNNEIQRSCKKKIIESVFEYLDVIKNFNGPISLQTSLARGNQLIIEMSKVAEPIDMNMKEEMEKLKMKNEINELFERTLPKASGSKLEARNKVKARLVKKLHIIKKTGHNPDNTEKNKEEISKAVTEIGANLTQENINEFIRNLKQSKIIRIASSSGSHKTASRIFCNINYHNFVGLHATHIPDSIPNDPNIPNYTRKRFSQDEDTGFPFEICHVPMSGQKSPIQVNQSRKESEEKSCLTLYGNKQRQLGPENKHVVQNHVGGQRIPAMGCHIIRTSGTAQAFESHNDQEDKPQSENISRGSGVQKTTEQGFFGRCSCSISEFENCCGRSRDPDQNTIEMVAEQTSTCGLSFDIPRQSQITPQSRGRQSEVHGSTTQRDHEVVGQHTTSSQTIAVQIAEQGCVAQKFPNSISPPQSSQVPIPNSGSCQVPNVVHGFGTAKTVSQYNTASGNTCTHLRDSSKQCEPPLSHSTTAPVPLSQKQPVNVPLSNKPSFCKSILPPPESTPEAASIQHSLLSEHPAQQRSLHSQSQKSGSKESSYSQNQLKLVVKNCCSQKEPHQFRVLSIPGPESTGHGSSRTSYAFLGLSRRIMINIPRQTRSLSPGHYQLLSPTVQPDLQRQYLYTIKQGRSFYTHPNNPGYEHGKQNMSTSVLKYYSPQNGNPGCSIMQTQIYQPVATSTETIACRSAEIGTSDGTSNFRDQFRVESIQEHRNYNQNLSNQPVHDPCCESNKRNSVCHDLDRCSLHKKDDRSGKKCYHIECKGYFDCAHIPVLQYCESVEDFLPTWLPQQWLGLSRKKKK